MIAKGTHSAKAHEIPTTAVRIMAALRSVMKIVENRQDANESWDIDHARWIGGLSRDALCFRVGSLLMKYGATTLVKNAKIAKTKLAKLPVRTASSMIVTFRCIDMCASDASSGAASNGC